MMGCRRTLWYWDQWNTSACLSPLRPWKSHCGGGGTEKAPPTPQEGTELWLGAQQELEEVTVETQGHDVSKTKPS